MRRLRFLALAVLAVSLVGFGNTTVASGGVRQDAHHVDGPPDTYVAAWDAIGTQAFTRRGADAGRGPHDLRLRGDRGVRLGDGDRRADYEPFAVDVDAPRRRLGRGRGRRGRPPHPRPLPAGPGGHDPRPGLRHVAGQRSRTARRRPTASPSARRSRRALIALRAGRRLPGPGDLHAAEPADPRRLDPDRPHAADRALPRPDATRSASTRPTSSVPTDHRRCAAGSGRATTTRSRRSARARARRGPPTRPWPPGSGLRRRSSRHAARSAGSSLDHELDVVAGGPVHGDDLGDLRRRPHRLLRRQVPLRVLAADHRDPRRRHRRQRRDGRRPGVDAAAPRHAEPSRVPERPLLHHPGRRDGSSPIPRDTAHRLHRPQPDRPRRPPLRTGRATSSTRSATPASGAASTTARRSRTGVEIGKRVAHEVLHDHFGKVEGTRPSPDRQVAPEESGVTCAGTAAATRAPAASRGCRCAGGGARPGPARTRPRRPRAPSPRRRWSGSGSRSGRARGTSRW